MSNNNNITNNLKEQHVNYIRSLYYQTYGNAHEFVLNSAQNSIKVTKDLYQEPSHFLYELIQNVDDSSEPINGRSKIAVFSLSTTNLTNAPTLCGDFVMMCNEKGFEKEDVSSICGVGNSTKAGVIEDNKRKFIGEKGIGFKSVFNVSDQPHIFSNGFYFRLNSQPESKEDHSDAVPIPFIIPRWVGPNLATKVYTFARNIPTLADTFSQGQGTILVLPINTPQNYKIIKEAMKSVKFELILFLRTLGSLNFYLLDQQPSIGITISKELVLDLSYAQIYKVTKDSNIGEWLVVSNTNVDMSQIKEEKRIGVTSAGLSIALPLDINSVCETINNGVLHAFLPTMAIARLPFLVNGDFVLVPSRDHIKDSSWNNHLLDKVPLLFCDTFERASRHFYTNNDFMRVAVFWEMLQHNESMYTQRINKSIINIIKTKKIVPVQDGGFELLNTTVFADIEAVDLITNAGLRFIKPYYQFASTIFMQHWMPNFPIIRDQFPITSFDVTWWRDLLFSSWLGKHTSIEWFIQLYTYLASKNIAVHKTNNYGDVFPPALLTVGTTVVLRSMGYYIPENLRKVKKFVVPPVYYLVHSSVEKLLDNDKSRTIEKWMIANLGLRIFSEFEYCQKLASEFHQLSNPISEKIDLSKYLFATYFKQHKANPYIPIAWNYPSFPLYTDLGTPISDRNHLIKPYRHSSLLKIVYGLQHNLNKYNLDSNSVKYVRDRVLADEYFGSDGECCNFAFLMLFKCDGIPDPYPVHNNRVHSVFPWLRTERSLNGNEALEQAQLLQEWISNKQNNFDFVEFYSLPWCPTDRNTTLAPKDIFVMNSNDKRHFVALAQCLPQLHSDMKPFNGVNIIGNEINKNCVLIAKYLLNQITSGKNVTELYPAVFDYLNAYASFASEELRKLFRENAMIGIANKWECIDSKQMIFPSEINNSSLRVIANYVRNVRIIDKSTLFFQDKVYDFIIKSLQCTQNLQAHHCLAVLHLWSQQTIPELDLQDLNLLYSFLANCSDWKDAVRLQFHQLPLIYCNTWKKVNDVVWVQPTYNFFPEVYAKVLQYCNIAPLYPHHQDLFCNKLRVSTTLTAQHHLNVLKEVANLWNNGQLSSQVNVDTMKQYIDFAYQKIILDNKTPIFSINPTPKFYFDTKDVYLESERITLDNSPYPIAYIPKAFTQTLRSCGLRTIDALFEKWFYCLPQNCSQSEIKFSSEVIEGLPDLLQNFPGVNIPELSEVVGLLKNCKVIQVDRLLRVFKFKNNQYKEYDEKYLWMNKRNADEVDRPYQMLSSYTFYISNSVQDKRLDYISGDIAKLIAEENSVGSVSKVIRMFLKKSPTLANRKEVISDIIEVFRENETYFSAASKLAEGLEQVKASNNNNYSNFAVLNYTSQSNSPFDSPTKQTNPIRLSRPSISYSTQTTNNTWQIELGRWGENHVYKVELPKKYPKDLYDHYWLNEDGESYEPIDIKITRKTDGHIFYIEVKATFENPVFYLSQKEWEMARQHGENYYVYRVFNCNTDNPRIQIIQNLWQQFLGGTAEVKSNDKYIVSIRSNNNNY